MKHTIFIVLIILQSVKISACCAEKDYRLFPIGESNNEIIFVEFDLFRYCDKGVGVGPENDFWISGTINLVKKSTDSLLLVENIDTIRAKECICTYDNFYERTDYENITGAYYEQALLLAQEMENFKIIETKQVIFNDTLNVEIFEEITDTTFSYILKYKDLLEIDLGAMEMISCLPNKASEVRSYETENQEVIIIRLRCHLEKNFAVLHNEKRFENRETAYWKEQAQWHGIAKDYYVIRDKKR